MINYKWFSTYGISFFFLQSYDDRITIIDFLTSSCKCLGYKNFAFLTPSIYWLFSYQKALSKFAKLFLFLFFSTTNPPSQLNKETHVFTCDLVPLKLHEIVEDVL
jgi:hypothetical protein